MKLSFRVHLAAFLVFVACASPPALAQNTPGTPVAADAVDADVRLLFSLAALFNPSVFGGLTTGWHEYEGYTYQYFINSRTYAGVRNGQVFVLGGAYGNAIAPAGSLADVLALLMDKTGAHVIATSRPFLEFEYANGAINLPQAQSFTLSAKLPTGWTLVPGATWLNVSQASGTTGDGSVVNVSINNNALTLPKGRNTALILVRNASDQHLSMHVPVTLWVGDHGVGVSGATADVFDFDVTNVALDAKYGNLYFTDQYSKRVYQVDTASGLTQRYWQLEKTPDHLAISPDGKRLYVGLLDAPHTYWNNWAPESGAIGIINLESELLLGQFPIALDPDELVATNDKVLVAGGSNQWTSISAYDVHSGQTLGAAGSVYMGARLSLHPNQQWLYSSDVNVSPGDIRKYDVSGEGVVALGDSPYHGDHATWGGVWAAPNGRHLYTRGGDVFLASSLLYVTTLVQGEAIADLGFDTATNSVVILTDSNKLQRYGLADFRFLHTVGSGLVDPRFVLLAAGDVIVVDFVTGEYVLKRF